MSKDRVRESISVLRNLDDFEYVSDIHGGSFAVTKKYQHKIDKSMYCMKEFRRKLLNDKEMDLFLNEVSILKSVNHEAVLKLYAYNQNMPKIEKPIIVTKFYPKSLELYTGINALNLPLSEKYIIILGISEGLKYLHSKNITHRDLKPANILLDENNHPVIGDFGQSQFKAFMLNKPAGTYAYMAPEIVHTFGKKKQVQKDNIYDNKCDVFSFAIVFYELYTSGQAYGDTLIDRNFYIEKIVRQKVRPKTDQLPKSIENFLNKCWSDKPENRPTFSEIVDEIKTKRFRDEMRADIQKVTNYLELLSETLTDSIKESDIEEIKRLADNHDIGKAIQYADILYNRKDYNESLHYFQMAAVEESDSYSIHQCAIIYEKLYDGGSLSDEAIDYLKKSINEGNYDSLKFLVETSYKDVKPEFFKICADKGSLESTIIYANLLYDGEIAEENKANKAKEKAAEYFEKAAGFDDVDSMLRLAKMYQKGDGIQKNPGKATILYQKAVAKNNPEAMLNYAIFLLTDGYAELHYNEIVNLFKRSADLGNVCASLCYSIIKKRCYLNESRNVIESNKYFKLAEEAKATEREIESAFNLGGMIFRGEVQPFKSQDAVFFIEKAAKGGNGSAMFYYSLLLYDGEFCDRDESESIHMLRSSILKSSPESAEAYTYIVNKFGTEFYNNDNDSIYREALEYSTTRTIIKTSNFLDRGESLRLLKKVCSKNYSAGIEAYSSVRGIFHKLFYEMEKVRHENNIDENFHVASIIVLSLNDESNKKRIIKHMKKIGVNTVEGVYGEIKDAYEMIYQKELNNDNIHIKLKEMLSESDF